MSKRIYRMQKYDPLIWQHCSSQLCAL